MCDKKKLLEGLEGHGIQVSVRSLARFMSSNGVMVTPHVGRQRGYVSMPLAAYGVDETSLSDEGGAFYKERVSQGHMSFIPKENEAELQKLETRLRRTVERKTLDGEFMPVSAYEGLKAEFEAIRTEYFNCRDRILAQWDTFLKDFEDGAKAMLESLQLQPYMKEAVMKEFMAGVPQKNAYANSFTMTLHVKAFPAEACPGAGLADSVAADVTSTWKDDVVSTAILSIEKTVGDGWNRMSKAMKQYVSKGTIKESTITSLVKFGSDLSWKNVFSNELLAEMCGKMRELSLASSNTDERAQIIEDCVVNIYGYAKETRISLDWSDSPYDEPTLEILLKTRNTMVQKGA